MPKKRVLFLCTGNYYRSRFSEILFNHLAKERGLNWEADSSGLHVQGDGVVNHGPLSPWTREVCRLKGLSVGEPCRLPRQVSEEELAGADLVIAVKEAEHRAMMQRLHPTWADRIQYWHVHDLDCATADVALAELEVLVRQLVKDLQERETLAHA